MQLKHLLLWGFVLLSYGCAPVENLEPLYQEVLSIETRNSVTEVTFKPYQHEDNYCRYDVLLIRNFGDANSDKHLRTYLKGRGAGICSDNIDEYVEIASGSPSVVQTFAEGLIARNMVLQECSEDIKRFTACKPMLATQTHSVIAIEGPVYEIEKTEKLACFEYWLNNTEIKAEATTTQQICTSIEGPVSAEVDRVFD